MTGSGSHHHLSDADAFALDAALLELRQSSGDIRFQPPKAIKEIRR